MLFCSIVQSLRIYGRGILSFIGTVDLRFGTLFLLKVR